MSNTEMVRQTITYLVILGMLGSNGVLAQSPAVRKTASSLDANPQNVLIRDVKLTNVRGLSGQLVDRQGNAQVSQAVYLQHAKTAKVLRTESQADGSFQFDDLRGGVYQVVSAGAHEVVRVWPNHVAPPKCQDQIMLVSHNPVVSAQSDVLYQQCESCYSNGGTQSDRRKRLATALIIGGIAVGIAVPIATSSDNNNRDEIQDLLSSMPDSDPLPESS